MNAKFDFKHGGLLEKNENEDIEAFFEDDNLSDDKFDNEDELISIF